MDTPFLIYKEYDYLKDFNADDFPEIGLMFMIKEKDEYNTFPVYRYTGDDMKPYSYITGLSNGEAIKGDKGDPGQDGMDGTTYTPAIGIVTSLLSTQNATVTVEVDEHTKTAVFNFGIPKGNNGDKGNDGINGADGITPHIGNNGNWFIGDIDTEVTAKGERWKINQKNFYR